MEISEDSDNGRRSEDLIAPGFKNKNQISELTARESLLKTAVQLLQQKVDKSTMIAEKSVAHVSKVNRKKCRKKQRAVDPVRVWAFVAKLREKCKQKGLKVHCMTGVSSTSVEGLVSALWEMVKPSAPPLEPELVVRSEKRGETKTKDRLICTQIWRIC